MDKIRYGIIGYGTQGTAYAKILTGTPMFSDSPAGYQPEHATLGAICDADPARREAAARDFPGIPVCADYRELIASGNCDAIITTVLDSSLEISATIASSGYNGMTRGGYTDGRKDLMRMDYLPSSSIIRNKDQVVTAGSTVYPRNLILGYVVDAGYDTTGVAKYAMVEPAIEIGRLEQIFILTDYNTSAATANSGAATTPTEATEPVDSNAGVG